MVLIFSIKYDYSTTCVIDWLNHWGIKTIRINGDDDIYKFVKITKEGIYFKNAITNEIVNLLQAKACWWRRIGIRQRNLNPLSNRDHFINDDLDLTSFIKGKNNILDEEAKALIEYIFYSIYKKCSINLGKPVFNLNRLIVSDIAQKYGLRVPSYNIIKNSAQIADARNFFDKMITKAISNGIYRDLNNYRFYTYTEFLEESFIEENKENEFFPSLVSEMIEKKIEIRTFYIDGIFYSMAIFSQGNEQTKIDFRKYSNNRREPYRLPNDVEIKIERIFKELDLNCGSVDLIIDKEDNFVFLEINPVGQFGMTSEPGNYNLDKVVAKYLIHGPLTKAGLNKAD